jgi:hypothetical protein
MKIRAAILLCGMILFACATSISAQTTSFTYQGKLTDSSISANGPYDFTFRLFDSGGTQVGSDIVVNDLGVSAGIFTVNLDFGSAAFDGSARYLDIQVRPGASSGAFTLLSPRQPVTSAPYAIRSLSTANAELAANSNQLGGLPATAFIQNTTTQQPANFNISGNGSVAGTISGTDVNANAEYDLGGFRLLSASGTGNLFAGLGSGLLNTGTGNSFFGASAGSANTSGGQNAFFGFRAGLQNNSGSRNSFFGKDAGVGNTTGTGNSYFGTVAGATNATGLRNSFFGDSAGTANTASDNSFFGDIAGVNTTTGTGNSFFGSQTGVANTTGSFNTFMGDIAGNGNTTGSSNSFFGSNNGVHNTSGSRNSFFGDSAGLLNTTATDNAFFGSTAGTANTTGSFNAFFGANSGASNTNAINNSFFGQGSGFQNTTGANNTFIGNGSGLNNTTASGNTFSGSLAGQSNTNGTENSFFGFQAGNFNTTADKNAYFGRNAGFVNNGSNNSYFGWSSGVFSQTGNDKSFFGFQAGGNDRTGDNITLVGANTDVGSSSLSYATAIGANAVVSSSNTVALGRADASDTVVVPGKLEVDTLGTAGSTQVCINSSNRIASCSSSLRYKTDLAPYRPGIDIIRRLRPITFDWKDTGHRDLGFGAEDVAKIDPLLVTYNAQGQVEGVKYDRITTALVNAVNEQQAQIAREQKLIDAQNVEIEALKRVVCASNKRATACRK